MEAKKDKKLQMTTDYRKKVWCEEYDSNAQTPTRPGSEPGAFDLAGELCQVTVMGVERFCHCQTPFLKII